MKIVCVCGMGMGTSLIMKMTIDNAARELGLDAEVEHWDVGTVGSKDVDLIVASQDFADNLSEYKNVIFLKLVLCIKTKNISQNGQTYTGHYVPLQFCVQVC